MTWTEDLAAIGRIRDRLAGSEHLDPDAIAQLVNQAEQHLRRARSALRRADATVTGLESAGDTGGHDEQKDADTPSRS